MHHDQLGAEITYFKRLLKKKKQFNIIIIHNDAHFSDIKLVPTYLNNGDSSQIFPCTVLCMCRLSVVHLGLFDFKDYGASLKDTGEEDILDVYFVSNYSNRKSIICLIKIRKKHC